MPTLRQRAKAKTDERQNARNCHNAYRRGMRTAFGCGLPDMLLTAGVLDLRNGPQVLHVPDMAARCYSVQFTAPNNTVFAYVGTRTTGTRAGDYLITGPGWKGQVPSGVKQMSSPHNSVFAIGRILVYSDSDLPTAYALTKQIQVVPG